MASAIDNPALATPSSLSGRSTRLDGRVASPLAFSQWLDFIRWIAAFAVVLDHCGNRFLVPASTVPASHRGILFLSFAFLAGFAHQAVMVFFVLSGYLVGGSLWQESKQSHSVRVAHYLINRISRLCIVLYPAFMLIAVLNLIGMYVFKGSATGIYGPDVLDRMRGPALACNAAFLQTAFCDTYGNDGALWSLFNEFWYYVVWLLVMLGYVAGRNWKRIIFFVLACATLALLGTKQFAASAIAPYMLIWILGVVVSIFPRPLIASRYLATGLFLAGLLSVRLLVRRGFEESSPAAMFLVDLFVSALFANLMVAMKYDAQLRPPWFGAIHSRLAAFSFSLYCIHIPVMNFYGAALKQVTGTGWKMLPDSAQAWTMVFGAIALSVIAGYLFSRITEAHTGGLRRLLSRRFESSVKPTTHA